MMGIVATAAAATKGMLQPTHPVHAKWHRISAPLLPRSSHTLSVINGRAYIFGGEMSPREPVDNDMHIITLPSGTVSEADYQSVPAVAKRSSNTNIGTGTSPAETAGEVPEKRVGHTAAVIGERIFIFGGREGKDMKPLEEHGRVWVFDTRSKTWSYLDPIPGTPYPEARSYHASVAHPKPDHISRNSIPLNANPATEEPQPGVLASTAPEFGSPNDAYGTVFIHAGCLSNGRTNDLWAFDIFSQTWRAFPSAPGKARGGTALTISKNRIYRYGGFNGESEEGQGGQVDFLELAIDTFADISGEGQGEVALVPKDHSANPGWHSLILDGGGDENLAPAGQEGGNRAVPGPRSVAGLHPISTGMGREYLVLLLGERDPSSAGHDGAGKFWADVWVFQVPPLGATGASVKDATWQALGRETGEALWSRVYVGDAEGREGEDVAALVPGERGWFASDGLGDLDAGGVVVWGGLNGLNQREGDGWILRVR